MPFGELGCPCQQIGGHLEIEVGRAGEGESDIPRISHLSIMFGTVAGASKANESTLCPHRSLSRYARYQEVEERMTGNVRRFATCELGCDPPKTPCSVGTPRNVTMWPSGGSRN